MLRAETAPGTALDKLAAFLVAALETRRARGAFLSFRRGGDLPQPLQRRLHEHDTTVRMRLKRLLNKGRRDGSLALRNLDSAVELLLASLQVPTVVVDGPEQRMWDSELVELLLAALSEPHPPEAEPVKNVAVIHGSCLCGSVRYDIDGPFEVMSHCQCSMCRKNHGAAFATFVSVPISGFRWVAGEDADLDLPVLELRQAQFLQSVRFDHPGGGVGHRRRFLPSREFRWRARHPAEP